ncbi:MAG: 3-oxoacyl-ACP reductase [Marmoricola sp.]|jgi:3-oxoacyl-[acyl-carrier protein] reductase|nr:3-oxoacyl-ACP reductase [Marmoricola sp.]
MPTLTYDFHDRTVIVSGAAQGIGAELVRFFRAAGATVVAVDLDAAGLAAVCGSSGAVPVVGDVAAASTADAAVTAALEATGRVDILVNNAGILRDNVVWKITDDDWDLVLGVHAGGTFRLTRACVPSMRAQGAGRIVNVTSYTGLHGNVGQANYATAKAGIIGFTKTVAKEVARFGVTVNAISPNAATRMVEAIPEERRREIELMAPLARFGRADEMCAAVGFLASDEAAYITGVVLPVDGGLSI